MRVAIIGNGLLGLTLRHGPNGGHNIELFDHANCDITKPDSVRFALDGFDVAINTAAIHRLTDCEKDPMLAKAVNADGAANVASVLPTIYVSTDYVFGGKDGPHEEVMPGHTPTSVYGRTKLAGELATLERGGIVVRVSSLYGHYRSHKGPSFPDRIADEFSDLELPNDQVMSPTYAPDAAERILALASAFDGERRIFHAANAGSCTWYQFAQEIVRLTGRKGRKIAPRTAADPLRPRNSALRASEPLRHWLPALEEWAQERQRLLYVNAPSPLRSAR